MEFWLIEVCGNDVFGCLRVILHLRLVCVQMGTLDMWVAPEKVTRMNPHKIDLKSFLPLTRFSLKLVNFLIFTDEPPPFFSFLCLP